MAVAAKLYAEVEDDDRRHAARLSSQLESTLRDPAAKPIDIVINDISPTGFRATTATKIEGSNVRLGLPGVGMVDARVVRHAAGEYGCMFVKAITPEQIRTALSADSVVWGAFPMVSPAPGAAAAPVEKYPPLVSLAVIACAASACWGGVIGLTMALFR